MSFGGGQQQGVGAGQHHRVGGGGHGGGQFPYPLQVVAVERADAPGVVIGGGETGQQAATGRELQGEDGGGTPEGRRRVGPSPVRRLTTRLGGGPRPGPGEHGQRLGQGQHQRAYGAGADTGAVRDGDGSSSVEPEGPPGGGPSGRQNATRPAREGSPGRKTAVERQSSAISEGVVAEGGVTALTHSSNLTTGVGGRGYRTVGAMWNRRPPVSVVRSEYGYGPG